MCRNNKIQLLLWHLFYLRINQVETFQDKNTLPLINIPQKIRKV